MTKVYHPKRVVPLTTEQAKLIGIEAQFRRNVLKNNLQRLDVHESDYHVRTK